MTPHEAMNQTRRLWSLISSDDEALRHLLFKGPSEQLLPSVFDITGFAAACAGIANLSIANLKSARLQSKRDLQVEVDVLGSVAAFRSESLLQAIGWQVPKPWDPIAGDYRTCDGWIRLHTNYKTHRDAALKVLGLDAPSDRDTVAERVSRWTGSELETAIVTEGGCAAKMYSRHDWLKTEFGRSTLGEPALTLENLPPAASRFGGISAEEKALAGIRILDLTRVIAGPECTKILAGHGADVLRIDPPAFEEVPALLPETTVGKRCAALDFSTSDGKSKLMELIEQAHVLVIGLRADALSKMNLDVEQIRKLNPAIVIAKVNAYGWNSVAIDRRGFDSLVQMSAGVAELGMQQKKSAVPFPLPAQALDHGAGFLLAAGICQSLRELFQRGSPAIVRASLVGISNFLFEGPRGNVFESSLDPREFEECLIDQGSAWGPLKRVRLPGTIDGQSPSWLIEAGPLGRHPASF